MADNDHKNRSEYFEERAGTEDARFHVVPGGDEGGWAIKREGEDDPVERYDDRDKAIDDAISRAKEAGSIAVIHDEDGQIERQENFDFDEDDDNDDNG
ncbi:DUF2188 domain-containing protein [Indiicoccus explosivorum]|uniref:DUF2188 domain-containing protein n=1 Tax=Indiicoccus explosivorum TaxID=1917864 RepID=UPI000B43082B|nr:DUF2188 domain-containing protein [Indiicoccus explosivorum]